MQGRSVEEEKYDSSVTNGREHVVNYKKKNFLLYSLRSKQEKAFKEKITAVSKLTVSFGRQC
jgi:hypothetical protein